MKVVMISDYTLGKPYGGLQTHVYHLSKHMSSLNSLELHIITFSDEDIDRKIDNIHFHFIKNPKIPRLFTIIQNTKSIKKKINEINPDLVHVHGTHYPYGFIAGVIANEYPTILTVHGIMHIEYKYNHGLNFLGAIVSVLLEKYALSKVKNIIVCSEPMKELLNNRTKANISIIPNGIEFCDINNVMPLKSIKYPSIIFMGLLEKIKGIDLLIEAIPIIKNQIPDIHLYIAGKGSQMPFLKNLVKDLDIQDNVNFLGYLKSPEKYAYIKSVDICAVPSRYESFGITILESMACKTPIIASNVGNIPYLINDDEVGLKVNSEDVNDLAEKIIFLLKNKDLKEKIKLKGLERVKKFKWEEIATKTIKTYNTIINNHKIEHSYE